MHEKSGGMVRNVFLTHYEVLIKLFEKIFLGVPRHQIYGLIIHMKTQESHVIPKSKFVNENMHETK